MSIPSLMNTRTHAESRRSAPERAGPSGPTFRDQLNAAMSGTARAGSAPASAGLSKDDLLSALLGFRSAMLDRMKLNKEKKDEKEAWDRMMEYLDAWIRSLQEGSADIEKAARAYAALKAAEEDERTGRMDAGGHVLGLLEKFPV